MDGGLVDMRSLFIRSPESFKVELIFVLGGRLLLILLLVEVLVMFALRLTGISSLAAPTSAIADGVLLAACSAPLAYFWVLLPALREFRQAEERMHLLDAAMRDDSEAMIVSSDAADGIMIKVLPARGPLHARHDNFPGR